MTTQEMIVKNHGDDEEKEDDDARHHYLHDNDTQLLQPLFKSWKTKNTKHSGKRSIELPGINFSLSMMERGPWGMVWTKMAHSGPPGTSQKSAIISAKRSFPVKFDPIQGSITHVHNWLEIFTFHTENVETLHRMGAIMKKVTMIMMMMMIMIMIVGSS